MQPLMQRKNRRTPGAPVAFILALLLCACSGEIPPIAPLAQDAIVLAFGDSLTYGTGATREHSYPAWLERLIKRRIVNAGVPGELSAQGRERLPRLLKEHKPDLLILCHGGNDLLRRLSPADMQNNLAAMIDSAAQRNIPVLLIGVPAFGLLFLEADEAYEALAEKYSLLYEGKVLPRVESDPDLKSDRIHPNAEGYKEIALAVHQLLRDSGTLK